MKALDVALELLLCMLLAVLVWRAGAIELAMTDQAHFDAMVTESLQEQAKINHLLGVMIVEQKQINRTLTLRGRM